MNNKLMNILNSIVDYFLLNLLWVIASIPLFTLFPATAALFGVVRKRQLQKETDGVIKEYIKLFIENFKQSFGISILWVLVAFFLYMDYSLIHPEQSFIQVFLYMILCVGTILFVSLTVYLFPIMVHFELSWKFLIRNAFFFTLMYPVLTILLLIIIIIGGYLIYIFPVAIFFIGSPVSYIIYHLCQGTFNQIIAKKGM
ncbi:YesL family protein [Metabacillus litoralis]|uniref:YesL family protein n=1 Tax=Metabacillus litoralis TaxID=152268 RepID=UPI001CFF4E30|nr:DUF624 domain-containing protein [Metabacillus litoralis]